MRKSIWIQIVLIYCIYGLNLVKNGQSQDIWTKTYGGMGYDYAYSVQPAIEGGYIIAGVTNSYGWDDDAWLLRIDSNGDTIWTGTYDRGDYDGARSVQQTLEGNYIITGETYNADTGDYDVLLIKTNPEGDTLWTKKYGGIEDDVGISVIKAISDSGYIILARTLSFNADYDDTWLIRTNSAGDTLWTKLYREPGWNNPESIQLTQDSCYIIAGWTEYLASPKYHPWLIKTDSSGAILWSAVYSGIADIVYGLEKTPDEGYIITGETTYYGDGNGDVILIKTDSEGDTVWTRAYGGAGYDQGKFIKQTSDQGYIVIGHTSSFGTGDYDIFLIKTDAGGDTIWTKTYGGYEFETGNAVYQTPDNGYILTGWTESFGAGQSDLWLIKTDSLGNTEDYLPQVVIADNFPFPEKYQLFQNYPNPFNATTKISYKIDNYNFVQLKIYDLLGREIKTLVNGYRPADTYTVNFDASRLASGIYFYQLEVGDPSQGSGQRFVEIKKMIYLK
jgi:hypothetical protein